MSTKKIGEVIHSIKSELSTDTDNNRLNNLKSTDTSTTDSQGYWNDYYIDSVYSDLINQSFRAWYCNVFYKLGKARVEAIAELARKGNHPQRMFSYLLKKAINEN